MAAIDEFLAVVGQQQSGLQPDTPQQTTSALDQFLAVTSPQDSPVSALVQAPAGDFSFIESLRRGTTQLGANIASAFGFNEIEQNLLEGLPPAAIPDFRSIEDVGDVGTFIAERTTESLPNTGTSALSAGIGFALGGPIGAAIGFTIGAGTPLLGESRRQLREAGAEGTVGQALLPAAGNTALEALPIGKALRQMGLTRIFRDSAEDVVQEAGEQAGTLGRALDITRNTGELALTEGVVETSQELNNILASKFFTNQDVLALDDEEFETLLQAFVGGAAGGTGMSAIAQSVEATARRARSIAHSGRESFEQRERQKEKAAKEQVTEEDLQALLKEKEELRTRNRNFIVGESGEYVPLDEPVVEGRSSGPVAALNGAHVPLSHPLFNQVAERLTTLGARGGQVEGVETQSDAFTLWGNGQQVVELVEQTPPQQHEYILEDNSTVSLRDFQQEAVGFTKDLLTKLGLDLNVAVGDIATTAFLHDGVGTKQPLGHQWTIEGMGNIIGVDYNLILNRAKTKDDARGLLLDVLSHEIGHAIILDQWGKMPITEQAGLLKGYNDFVTQHLNGPVGAFSEAYSPGFLANVQRYAHGPTDAKSTYDAVGNVETLKYLFSFDEYAAQMIAKAVGKKLNESNSSQAERTFWNRMADLMREVWQDLKARYKATPTFEKWVDNLFLTQEINDLNDAIAGMNNPTGEINQIKTDVKNQVKTARDEGVLTPPTYKAQTTSFMADFIEGVGLPNMADKMRQHQDVILGFMGISQLLTPLQLSRLSSRRGITEPQQYIDVVQQFQTTKMTQVVQADEIAQRWRSLGKEASTRLGNFIFEVSTESDTQEQRLTSTDLQRLRTRFKLTDEEFTLWQDIDQSFQSILENVERGLMLDATRSFIDDNTRAVEFRDLYFATDSNQERLRLIEEYTGQAIIPTEGENIVNPLFAELSNIVESIKAMRNRNYFPRTRLGEYTIMIKSTKAGQVWEGFEASREGETIGFYAFDTKRERDAMEKAMRSELNMAGVSWTKSIMDSEIFAMMGMPEALIRNMMRDENLNLTPEQREQLEAISLNLSPGKRFLKHLKRRKGIAGFSTDGLRVYSHYMMSAANHLARVEHSKSMLNVLSRMDQKISQLEANNAGGDIAHMVKLKDYFRRHFDYLMNPDNDWAQLRSVGFLWYLGFNVKSALINLTQIPMVTYPFLAGHYGDRQAAGQLRKAYSDVVRYIRNNKKLADDELAMIESLTNDGIIDESMVMELAGLGEQDVLKRTIPGWDIDNILNKASYYGAGMFRMAEKYNRLVTALASYRLAKKKGEADPIIVARNAIQASQFEYAKWNRPEFMRGKKSVIFLFWQYMQNAAFLFFGGEGKKTAMRMWILALMVAGVEGLPFATTLFELIDFFGTEAAEAMGVANPRVTVREDMRDLILEISDKPDVFMRGLSSYWGLGPLHLLTQLGAPIPNVDTSGSLSLGSPVPFLDELFVGQDNPDEELGKFTAALLGPVGGMALQAYRSATSTDPNTWKNIERTMPVFIKNAMQGGRWLAEGEETFRGGGTFLNMDRPAHRVSAIMKALGFQSTRVTQKFLQVNAQQQAATYWTLRKSLLLEDYAYAVTIENREAKKDALSAITRHNKGLRKTDDLKGLMISSKDLSNSLKARTRSRILRERGIAERPRESALRAAVADRFPVPE